MKGGLSSCDAHPFQQPPALFKKCQKLPFRHGGGLSPAGQHQGRVVAKGAPEIAAGKKHGAGDFPRVVQQGVFLQTGNDHKKPPISVVENQYTPFRGACQGGNHNILWLDNYYNPIYRDFRDRLPSSGRWSLCNLPEEW